MTMPHTAKRMQEFGVSNPSALDDAQLRSAIEAIEEDLPGVVGFAEMAVQASLSNGGAFTATTRSIEDLGSREAWMELIGYTSRLFANPFGALLAELLYRRYGMSIAFVNCCKLVVQKGELDKDLWFMEQVSSQLSPDC